MSLFADAIYPLPAAALETLRGQGFRHQKQVANAFLTVEGICGLLAVCCVRRLRLLQQVRRGG